MTQSAPRRPSFRSSATDRPADRPASPKAAAYRESMRDDMITALAELAALDAPAVAGFHIPPVREVVSAGVCSGEIDDMRDALGRIRELVRAARRTATASAAAALVPDRLYETPDGEIYRTVMSGAGNMYAKVWTDEGWEYDAPAIRRIRPEHRMTVERALELSLHLGRCIRCAALLTAEESVARGIGPVCITKI